MIPLCLLALLAGQPAADFTLETKQVTFGPQHHFYGYIGHVRTIPWNESGRYLLTLRTTFQDRMPKPGEAADVLLLDTRDNYKPRQVDQTRAWNFQQGTMMYWNPAAPETQFFFNDRDPKTNEVFCVLFDLSKGKAGERVAEYRFKDTPIGNGGVAQNGGWFAAINYGRLARLRSVTGYPGAHDWTVGKKHPTDDGVFKVNVKTKEKVLLVSFKQMADALRAKYPGIDERELFINHTLWSRDDSRLFFFARADFGSREKRVDAPFTVKADGTGLTPLAQHIGGHPEWASGHVMIGIRGKDQILFDVDKQEVVGTLGSLTIFPNPNGDVALSADGKWFINGHPEKGKNYYTVLRRADGAWARTAEFDQGGYTGGDLRIDSAPAWDRDARQFVAYGVDKDKSRQMFVVTVKRKDKP